MRGVGLEDQLEHRPDYGDNHADYEYNENAADILDVQLVRCAFNWKRLISRLTDCQTWYW